RFLLFCAFAAIAGALLHYLTHMADLEPVIGASAAVSGVMAAAVRFVFQPGAPLDERLGFSDRAPEEFAYRLPALPLRTILSSRGGVIFLLFGFLAIFLFGAAHSRAEIETAAFAWKANIGGFLFGFLPFRCFAPPAPPNPIRPPRQHAMPWD